MKAVVTVKSVEGGISIRMLQLATLIVVSNYAVTNTYIPIQQHSQLKQHTYKETLTKMGEIEIIVTKKLTMSATVNSNYNHVVFQQAI